MFAASKTDGSAAAPDAQFNYVTMLLHGDGTNGAQNNTFLDSSTNAFSITRNGNTTQGSFSPYGSNWSNFFDGSTDFLTAGTTATDFLCTGSTSGLAATFEAFVFPTAWNGNSGIRNNTIWGKDGTYISVGLYNGYIQFYWYSGSANTLTSSSTIPLNTWSYIAVTVSGSTVTFYINGISDGSGTMSSGIQTGGVGTSENIGSQRASSPGVSYFSGYISNFKISNIVRSITSTPTTLLTSDANTKLLVCQSNRFVDNSSNSFAVAVGAGTPSVQRFNPFGISTAYSTSVIGGSGYFDGSDYLAISDGGGSALDMGTGDCTIEMWVYPDTQSTSFPSMFAPKNGWSTGTFYIRYQGSKFGIYWNSVGDPVINSTNSYAPNAWYHVAFTRSGSTITLWVNGVSAGTATTSASLNLAIGGEVWLGNNTSAGCYYKGLLSNVRVVKGTAVYTSTFTPPTSPLTAISGTSLLTNFTNGAIFDNAMMNDLETVGNAQISTSVKKYGTGSLYFDGTGDNLYTVNSGIPATGAFTLEMWIYPTSTSGYQLIYSQFLSGNGGNFQLLWNDTASKFTVNDGSGLFLTSSSTYSTNAWYHLAIVRSGSTFTMYVNGTSVASGTNSYSILQAASYIGTRSVSDGYFNGYIDDLRITKGYARYTATFTPPTSALSDTGPY